MSTNKNINTTSKTFGPYSAIRRAGNIWFTSGHVGVDPNTKSAPNGIKKQIAVALSNLQQTLASEGLVMDDIVKTTVFLTDMADFSIMNDEYMSAFKAPRPARSTVAVRELPRVGGNVPLCVEIEAIATKGGKYD